MPESSFRYGGWRWRNPLNCRRHPKIQDSHLKELDCLLIAGCSSVLQKFAGGFGVGFRMPIMNLHQLSDDPKVEFTISLNIAYCRQHFFVSDVGNFRAD
jgi:hypothetical protein